MHPLRLSVIVSSYMHESYVEEAILSVLNQASPADEIIIVDDGSTDGSREIIERYKDRATVIFKANGGHVSAVNAACAVATGDVVCFLDSDDRFASNKLTELKRAWANNPDATMVYHQLRTIDAQGNSKGKPWPQILLEGEFSDRLRNTAGWWPRPTTSGLSFSKSYLDRVLPIPIGPRIWPDTYLAPCAAFCGKVVAIPQCLGEYRVHGKNTILMEFPPNAKGAEKYAVAKKWVEQFGMELKLLTDCLTRIGLKADDINLSKHIGLLSAQRDTGDRVSLWKHVQMIVTNPALPQGMKLGTLVRFVRSRLRGRGI